jgi:hypothetical protein
MSPNSMQKLDATKSIPLPPVVRESWLPGITERAVEEVFVHGAYVTCAAGRATPVPASSLKASATSVALSVLIEPLSTACRTLMVYVPALRGADNPCNSIMPRSEVPLRYRCTYIPIVEPFTCKSQVPSRDPPPGRLSAFNTAETNMRPDVPNVTVVLRPLTFTSEEELVVAPDAPRLSVP